MSQPKKIWVLLTFLANPSLLWTSKHRIFFLLKTPQMTSSNFCAQRSFQFQANPPKCQQSSSKLNFFTFQRKSRSVFVAREKIFPRKFNPKLFLRLLSLKPEVASRWPKLCRSTWPAGKIAPGDSDFTEEWILERLSPFKR